MVLLEPKRGERGRQLIDVYFYLYDGQCNVECAGYYLRPSPVPAWATGLFSIVLRHATTQLSDVHHSFG